MHPAGSGEDAGDPGHLSAGSFWPGEPCRSVKPCGVWACDGPQLATTTPFPPQAGKRYQSIPLPDFFPPLAPTGFSCVEAAIWCCGGVRSGAESQFQRDLCPPRGNDLYALLLLLCSVPVRLLRGGESGQRWAVLRRCVGGSSRCLL